jgi:hypothetical protein
MVARLKVRKIQRMRGRRAGSRGVISSEAAAVTLHVSPLYFESLVVAGILTPATQGQDGHPLFSLAAVLAYKKRSKAMQRSGLTRMMHATQRLGLYDAELDGLPRSQLFRPDSRQQKVIDEARREHGVAQSSGKYAPDRLVKK